MKKLDSTVKSETLRILVGTAGIGLLAQLVFILIGQWSLPVLLGSVLGGGWAVLNFLLMGITLQNTLGMPEQQARNKMKSSYSLRTGLTLAVLVVSILVPCFSWISAVVGIFSPRVTIAILSAFRKEYGAPVDNPLPVEDQEEDEDEDELEKILDRVYGGKVNYDTSESGQNALGADTGAKTEAKQ